MEDKIAVDLKAAMIAKDAQRVSVLRSLKSAFTYAMVASGAVNSDGEKPALSEEALQTIVAKEAKKRQESADSFMTAGQPDRADVELAEKAMIDAYLPAKLSQEEIQAMVDDAVANLDEVSMKSMGQVIGAVKAKAGPAADGALIARLVKERLSQ